MKFAACWISFFICGIPRFTSLNNGNPKRTYRIAAWTQLFTGQKTLMFSVRWNAAAKFRNAPQPRVFVTSNTLSYLFSVRQNAAVKWTQRIAGTQVEPHVCVLSFNQERTATDGQCIVLFIFGPVKHRNASVRRSNRMFVSSALTAVANQRCVDLTCNLCRLAVGWSKRPCIFIL